MLDLHRWKAILLVVFYSYGQTSNNYIYQEFNGNINANQTMKLSLFIRNFTGAVLYAVDPNVKLLIELEQNPLETFVIFKLNKVSVKMKSQKLCGCSQCSNIYVTFELLLSQSQATIQCNKQTQMIKINNEQTTAQFTNYPIPRNHSQETNKTFIWMGNIGHYVGNKDIYVLPLKNQLTGCLDKFHFNGKVVKIINTSDYFSNQCLIHYNDSICNVTECSNKLIAQNMFDCSLTSMNVKHCQNELFEYSGQHHSFMRINEHLNPSSIVTRLDWKMQYVNRSVNYCLMELQMRKKVSILFLFTHKSEVVMIINKNDAGIFKRVIGSLVPRDNINILLVEFEYFNMITKVSNGNDVLTHITSFSEELKLVNIGFAQYQNICLSFEGSMNFRYLPTQWRPVNEEGFNYLAYILLWFDVILLMTLFSLIWSSNKSSCIRSNANHFNLPFNPTNEYDTEPEQYEIMRFSPRDSFAENAGLHYGENISNRDSLVYHVIVNGN